MKKIIFTIFIFLIAYNLFSQYSINPFSSVETVNGFDNFRLGTDYAEPMIATNPTDPLNSICAFVYNRFYYTLDGTNWINITVTPYMSADPFVCYDSLGNAYYISYSGQNEKISKSTNKGLNWQTYTLYNNANLDKPSIIAVQSGGPFSNYVYATWQSIQGSYFIINFSRSTNGGVDWSNPQQVNVMHPYCPWLAVGPNGSISGGNVYCSYNGFSSDSILILIRRSTDAGNTFLNEIIAAEFYAPGNPNCSNNPLIKSCTVQANYFLQMAADNSYGPNRGNLYIIYGGRTTGLDSADIFFIRSTNYGLNWSAQRKINDDNTNTDQWMPSIAVDNKTGKIFITWYDSRTDPQNNLQTKLYGSLSTDGGNSFSTNLPISTISFNPQNIVSYFGWGGYMGHYNGISAIGNTSYVSWTDGRNNNKGSYVAYFPDFAIIVHPDTLNLNNNDSVSVTVKIPAINGPFNDRIKFSAVLDTTPPIGNIYYNFINRDSISTIPDSITLKIRISGVTIPLLRRIYITGHGTYNGVPVHQRTINLFLNSIGIRKISSNIPKEYNLYQNYPNPFNPKTIFKFDISKKSFTKLIIYDLLGREVETLINSKQQPGTYETEWDGSNFASGIYFYKLVSENYTSTKKMVLIK